MVNVKAWLSRLPRPRPRIRWRPPADLGFDLAMLAGLAAIAAGCGWIFPPAAPIVGGGFLAAVGFLAGRPGTEEPALTQEPRVIERWHSVDEDD